MKKQNIFFTVFFLYLNYLVHGMAIVILAQNMLPLRLQLGASIAQISYIISSLGIGRLLVLYISGWLSDCYGRKPFIITGILTYIPFFIGILLSKNILEAYICGILAGMANSFLDAGTYPALMEFFPRSQATVNILIKAFASVGELILPLMVTFLELHSLWYGWSFILCVIILTLNLFIILTQKFPPTSVRKKLTTFKTQGKKIHIDIPHVIAGILLTIYGYISMSTFYLISQWLTDYGMKVANLSMIHARSLVSVYSVGSIVGVLVNTLLVSFLLKESSLMIFHTSLSFLTLLFMSLIPKASILFIGSFIIGFSAAGGVMQIGLTLMCNLFPAHKGLVTGIYYTASSLSSFSIPLITGLISQTNIHNILWLDVFIAVIGFICSLLITIINKIIFKQKNTERILRK
ncbi:MFS transporter [Liquorilactobacillus mali]|uniref:MFS family major facilitator transporter n=1 Tax=Liquorilactobacillus mali KCTC 3596 = DSM 20444 TaxID=1046596 RepID=J0KZG7_9LACO|nr:MFS transporter [Liquorilactobacillus mali]EJE99966.1 MFS family major facilitator transporter [Liquorilactobacillus mali KCTC 3596 = DSM 20444]KRN11265.1 MFS family major facilitator transporter [Liquorilactobacillus mali KCTC 3596 = DSM 20444]QFQ73748.1 MFS transporter [Liquorilactobacillus mali]